MGGTHHPSAEHDRQRSPLEYPSRPLPVPLDFRCTPPVPLNSAQFLLRLSRIAWTAGSSPRSPNSGRHQQLDIDHGYRWHVKLPIADDLAAFPMCRHLPHQAPVPFRRWSIPSRRRRASGGSSGGVRPGSLGVEGSLGTLGTVGSTWEAKVKQASQGASWRSRSSRSSGHQWI